MSRVKSKLCPLRKRQIIDKLWHMYAYSPLEKEDRVAIYEIVQELYRNR